MMYKKLHNLRPAVAMLELIFAIVIIGITLMSAPQIISVSTQSSNVAMQQEAIAAASSQISLVLTRNWDELDSNSSTGYGILQVTSRPGKRNVDDFNMTRTYNVNIGSTHATPLANFQVDIGDSGVLDDIDDFDGQVQTLQLYAGETAAFSNNEGDYIDASGIYTTTSIAYGDDTATYASGSITLNNPFRASTSTSSNIKTIKVQLQTSTTEIELAKDVSLYAFSCNIGTPNIGGATIP